MILLKFFFFFMTSRVCATTEQIQLYTLRKLIKEDKAIQTISLGEFSRSFGLEFDTNNLSSSQLETKYKEDFNNSFNETNKSLIHLNDIQKKIETGDFCDELSKLINLFLQEKENFRKDKIFSLNELNVYANVLLEDCFEYNPATKNRILQKLKFYKIKQLYRKTILLHYKNLENLIIVYKEIENNINVSLIKFHEKRNQRRRKEIKIILSSIALLSLLGCLKAYFLN